MAFKLPKFGKLLKMKYNFNPVLQNQLVLYLFLFMTFTQIVVYVSNNDTTGIVLICLVGFLTSFFSKNMIVILCVALIMTNLLKKGMKQVGYEGFEENEEAEDVEEEEMPKKKDDKPKKKVEKKDEDEDDFEIPNSNELSDKTKDEMKRQFEDLKKDYPEFKELQDDLLEGLKKMDPILDKAETFMNKYSQYKTDKK
jgi:hypothetical protein|tara:strand:+ start:2539 stop:3129 length:591 start_codon:yes stop_codon:yes gene_type:complete